MAFFNRQGSTSDYFGTVRGRLGYAFDRVLVYGTGGVAFRDTGSRSDSLFFGLANNYGRVSNSDTGYAVGGGVEYAFTPNLTGKIEGLYVNFSNGNKNASNIVGVTNVNVPIVASGTRSREDDFAVVRAGLNYKFNLF